MVLLLLTIGVNWMTNREAASISLKYGEFKQLLHDPGVTFQNVIVYPSEIRGEVVTRDPVTGGDASELVKTVAWRTSRLGLETDADLQDLLRSRVGPGYRGAED